MHILRYDEWQSTEKQEEENWKKEFKAITSQPCLCKSRRTINALPKGFFHIGSYKMYMKDENTPDYYQKEKNFQKAVHFSL